MVAVADTNHDGRIDRSELQQFLVNIEARDRFSNEDIDEIMKEWGENDEIHVNSVEDLILGTADVQQAV